MDRKDAKDVVMQDAAWDYFDGTPVRQMVENAIDRYQVLLDTPDSDTDPIPPVPNPTPQPDPSPNPKTFRMFDNIVYQGKPSLEQYGIEPLDIIYAGEFFPNGVPKIEDRNFDMPDDSVIAKIARMSGRNCIIDIEHWWPDDHTGKMPLEDRAVQNYVRLMQKFLEDRSSSAKQGLYSTMVRRNYWTPVNDRKDEVEAWQRANNKAIQIGNLVDATYPSLYAFYDDHVGWETYAIANIKEAKRLVPERPCYPYLWPEYHSGNLGGQPIPPDYWKLMLETCRDYADGCVIWTLSSKTRKIPWSQVPEWWEVTKDFMAEVRSS